MGSTRTERSRDRCGLRCRFRPSRRLTRARRIAGEVNLIYIDPPFDTGANFSFTATIPSNPDSDEDESTAFIKEASILEQKAYRDTWGRGLDSYLQWFYETAALLNELLTETGNLYLHIGSNVSHYVKVLMDSV